MKKQTTQKKKVVNIRKLNQKLKKSPITSKNTPGVQNIENHEDSSNGTKNYEKESQMNPKINGVESIGSNNAETIQKNDFEVCVMSSNPYNKKKRIDPLKKDQLYANWRKRNKKGMFGLSKSNSDIILKFLSDMEQGLNTAKQSKKGGRSKARLLALAYHLKKVASLIKEKYNKNLLELDNRKQINSFFEEFKNGDIKTNKGEPYQSSDDFIRDFVCFWNWHVRVTDEENEEIDEKNRVIEKENRSLPKAKKKPLLEKKFVIDLVKYLARDPKENTFVHTTLSELKEVLPNLSKDDQTVALFLFDSIIRSPLEFSNIYNDDVTFYNDGVIELDVRNEIAKTYGRKFELVLCGDKLKAYIERHKLQPEDILFPHYTYSTFNKILQNAYVMTFGNKMTKGGKPFSAITGYSLRHSGACYFRFETGVSTDKIRLRGGWTDMRRLDYYTKVVGYKGRISKAELNGKRENEIVLKLIEKNNEEKDSMRQNHLQIIIELKTEYAKSMEELKDDYGARINELKQLLTMGSRPAMEVQAIPNV